MRWGCRVGGIGAKRGEEGGAAAPFVLLGGGGGGGGKEGEEDALGVLAGAYWRIQGEREGESERRDKR